MRFIVSPKMLRLKVPEDPQHAPRRSPLRRKTGNSPPARKAIKKKPTRLKKRTFLTKDEQALLMIEYTELPSPSKKGQGNKRSKAMHELCKKWDVNIDYPRKLIAQLKATKQLPTRDGVGGAPERIDGDDEVRMKDTLRENGYDLTYRQLATLTGIPSSTIWRYVKEHPESWRVVGKKTKPRLSENNVKCRAEWAAEHKDNNWNMQIDIDEKLFYAWSSRGKLKVPAEDEAPRTPLQSKRFIPKVMMLAAIGRPSSHHKFNGKIGMWPIGELRPAKRSNRRSGLQRGDMMWESATLDAERWVSMLVSDVFPAIRAKFARAKVVRVQFDNAPAHRTSNLDARIEAALTSARPHIKIVKQPPQSPCGNLCDLGFFNSIDSKLPKTRSLNMPEFIQQIQDAFNVYPSERIDSLCDTKRLIVDCIRAAGGENTFKLPHKRKHLK